MKVKLLDLQEQYLTIRGEVRRALDEVCDAQDFILGPRVERFEQNLAKYCHTVIPDNLNENRVEIFFLNIFVFGVFMFILN